MHLLVLIVTLLSLNDIAYAEHSCTYFPSAFNVADTPRKRVIIYADTTIIAYDRDTSKHTLDSIERSIETSRELFPNSAGKALLTPTGWGGKGEYVFAGIGGVFPQIYTKHPDFNAYGGVAWGDYAKFVNADALININDVSGIGDVSFSLFINRKMGRGGSLRAGGLHLFADIAQTDAGPSYFVAYSHAVQKTPSKTPGRSRLCYTVGAGSGRFYKVSSSDAIKGRALHGTIAFANVSYELFNRFNINAEWTGLNLGFAASYRPVSWFPPITIGIADITRYTADKPRLALGIGYTLSFEKFD